MSRQEGVPRTGCACLHLGPAGVQAGHRAGQGPRGRQEDAQPRVQMGRETPACRQVPTFPTAQAEASAPARAPAELPKTSA